MLLDIGNTDIIIIIIIIIIVLIIVHFSGRRYKTRRLAYRFSRLKSDEHTLNFLNFFIVTINDLRIAYFCRPVTGLEWSRGFQEVKVPRFRDNGTGWWYVVSFTHRPPLPPGNIPGTHFC